jgi:hypothetical protein
VTTAERAAALLVQAKNDIEAVLDAKLERMPRVRLGTEKDLESTDFDHEVTQLMEVVPHNLDVEYSSAGIRRCAPCAAASRCRGKNEILVFPAHLSLAASWSTDLHDVNTEAYLQLALVHEAVCQYLENRYPLVHEAVFQDSESDPNDADNSAVFNKDVFVTRRSLVAGRAQWVTREVAGRRGIDRYFPLLGKVGLHVADTDQKSLEARTAWRLSPPSANGSRACLKIRSPACERHFRRKSGSYLCLTGCRLNTLSWS